MNSKKTGFTLVELIITMVIISTLAGTIAHIMLIGMDSYTLISDRRVTLQKARLAMNLMTSELQMIQDPDKDIREALPTLLAFQNSKGEKVVFNIFNGDLMKNSSVLAKGVTQNTGFTYFSKGGLATKDESKIYRIHIDIEVEPNDEKHGRVFIKSDVYLRNRYYDTFSRE